MPENLSVKQKRFLEYYLIDGEVRSAAKKANYAEKSAYLFIKQPWIKDYIDKEYAAIHTARTAEAQEVMEYLTSVMRGEFTDEVIMMQGEGHGRTIPKHLEKKIDVKDRTAAANLLAKRYNLYNDGVNVKSEGGITINVSADYGE
jgi:phage terminase small subunit